ncbi:hypothetical protein HWQ46_22390 [Shewanella sp. D64]|nr:MULTISPECIES: hypothetical protein [unclassified Shewanella]MEC4728289.1 hypothetical protein [Shewanella sp. D64]MEC4740362.1 hypothetical protein [Shewanella sp. E94]WBJ98324.1 hypothetical protein HWQ47_15460 [Shewanella sp. MTB7]
MPPSLVAGIIETLALMMKMKMKAAHFIEIIRNSNLSDEDKLAIKETLN